MGYCTNTGNPSYPECVVNEATPVDHDQNACPGAYCNVICDPDIPGNSCYSGKQDCSGNCVIGSVCKPGTSSPDPARCGCSGPGSGCHATGDGCPVVCVKDANGNNTGTKCWQGKLDCNGSCSNCGGLNGCITDTVACRPPSCTPGATQTCTNGTCSGTQTCQSDGTWGACNAPASCPICTPSCSGKICGNSDGCGGTCFAGSGCTTPCTDTSWSCTVPYNGTETSNCGTVRANPSCSAAWFQAAGASVHSNAAITGIADSAIPAGSYFNQLADGFYGVVSAKSSISFSGAKTNSKLWQIINYPSTLTDVLINPKYDHNYFWTLYADKVTKTVNANQITSGDLQTSGSAPVFVAVHPISGNSVSIAGPVNVVGNKLLIVFVNSGTDPSGTPVNLTMVSNNPSTRVTVGAGAAVIWIVSGNVTIDSSVDQADGYWLSSGTFSDGSGTIQLNIWGGVASYGGVNLGRRNSNQALPSEIIKYNPNLVQLAPAIGESTFSWQETVP